MLSKEEIEEFAETIGGGCWNTRIIEHTENKEKYYAIHEVYYDKNDKPWAWSEEPINLVFEDKESFGEILRQCVEASEKPILKIKNGNLIKSKQKPWFNKFDKEK